MCIPLLMIAFQGPSKTLLHLQFPPPKQVIPGGVAPTAEL